MVNNSLQLDNLQLDILKEITNVGVGSASIALSKILDSKVDLSVPTAKMFPSNNSASLIEENHSTIAGIYFKILGDASGDILMILSKSSAFHLIWLLLDRNINSVSSLTEIENSVLCETANILTSAYLSAVSKLLNIALYPSIPEFVFDIVDVAMEKMIKKINFMDGKTLLLDTQFEEENSRVCGHFLLFLNKNSVNTMLNAAKGLTAL